MNGYQRRKPGGEVKEARILVQTLKCIKGPMNKDCRVLKDSMDLDVLAGATGAHSWRAICPCCQKQAKWLILTDRSTFHKFMRTLAFIEPPEILL